MESHQLDWSYWRAKNLGSVVSTAMVSTITAITSSWTTFTSPPHIHHHYELPQWLLGLFGLFKKFGIMFLGVCCRSRTRVKPGSVCWMTRIPQTKNEHLYNHWACEDRGSGGRRTNGPPKSRGRRRGPPIEDPRTKGRKNERTNHLCVFSHQGQRGAIVHRSSCRGRENVQRHAKRNLQELPSPPSPLSPSSLPQPTCPTPPPSPRGRSDELRSRDQSFPRIPVKELLKIPTDSWWGRWCQQKRCQLNVDACVHPHVMVHNWCPVKCLFDPASSYRPTLRNWGLKRGLILKGFQSSHYPLVDQQEGHWASSCQRKKTRGHNDWTTEKRRKISGTD